MASILFIILAFVKIILSIVAFFFLVCNDNSCQNRRWTSLEEKCYTASDQLVVIFMCVEEKSKCNGYSAMRCLHLTLERIDLSILGWRRWQGMQQTIGRSTVRIPIEEIHLSYEMCFTTEFTIWNTVNLLMVSTMLPCYVYFQKFFW